MERINLFFYYQRIYRRKKNYRRKIHRRGISVGDSVGKLITDGICVLHRRKNSVSKTVKSCSVNKKKYNSYNYNDKFRIASLIKTIITSLI